MTTNVRGWTQNPQYKSESVKEQFSARDSKHCRIWGGFRCTALFQLQPYPSIMIRLFLWLNPCPPDQWSNLTITQRCTLYKKYFHHLETKWQSYRLWLTSHRKKLQAWIVYSLLYTLEELSKSLDMNLHQVDAAYKGIFLRPRTLTIRMMMLMITIIIIFIYLVSMVGNHDASRSV